MCKTGMYKQEINMKMSQESLALVAYVDYVQSLNLKCIWNQTHFTLIMLRFCCEMLLY